MQQNNASVLSPAIPPDSPARPRLLLNFLASLVIGAALGIGAAMGLEKLDQRVRDPADLTAVEGIPVIGMLQAESKRYSVRQHLANWMSYLRRKRRPPPPPPSEPGIQSTQP